MLRPLLFTLLTLGIATCAAIAACHFAFGKVHILTLTFGTSLIGVSVDYSLHYFVNRMRDGGRLAAAQHRAGADPRLHDDGRGLSDLVRRADPGPAADRVVLRGGAGDGLRHA